MGIPVPRWTLVLLLAGLLIPATSCGGKDSEPDAAARLFIAQENKLGELTLGAQEPKQLLHVAAGGYILDPAVSADRGQVAFVFEQAAHNRADGTLDFGSDLYVASRNGGKPRLVLEHKDTGEYLDSPGWLDGETVLFARRGIDQAAGRSFFHIERLDLESGGDALVLNNAASPALTMDGDSLAYVAIDPDTRLQSLMISDASGRGATLLASEGFLSFDSPTFSPDGSRIAFAAIDLNPPPVATGPTGAAHPFAKDVWVMNKDGSGLRRISDIAESSPSITWSADGGSIYVLGGSGIVQIDATSGAMTAVDPGRKGSDIVRIN